MLGFGSRSLQQHDSSSEDIVEDDDQWTELDASDWKDWVHIALTGLYQLVVFVAVMHLWKQRLWPPYCPRQISLVCMTGLAGIVAYLGALVTAGTVRRRSGEFYAHCGFDALFQYATWGVWISVALVRVYRSWKILVKHSVDMWRPWAQVALLTVPWCFPAVVYTADEDLAPFNETRNWCESYRPIESFTYVLDGLLIAGAFVLVYQMRKVRKQMNEYHLQVFQLTFLLVTGTVVFPLQHAILDHRHEIRRIWVLYHNFFDSLVLFWPPIAEPMYRYLTGDAEYLHSYTHGFSTLPTPAQMKSSFRDQLSLEELRTEFEKFAEKRLARELPDFYQACLERDEIEDYFGRQAATSAIIDRFIRVGSVQEVNLSHNVRERILQTEITSFNIFSEAMSMVVAMMDTNFSAAFKQSEAYKLLEQHVKDEAEELEILKKMRQLPPKDHVQREAGGLLKLFRRLFHHPRRVEGDSRPSLSDAGCSSVEVLSTGSFIWPNNGGASGVGDAVPETGHESKEELGPSFMNGYSSQHESGGPGVCFNI